MKRLILGIVLLVVLVGKAQAVEIVTVPVGNPRNAGDTEIMSDSTTGYGGVDYA